MGTTGEIVNMNEYKRSDIMTENSTEDELFGFVTQAEARFEVATEKLLQGLQGNNRLHQHYLELRETEKGAEMDVRELQSWLDDSFVEGTDHVRENVDRIFGVLERAEARLGRVRENMLQAVQGNDRLHQLYLEVRKADMEFEELLQNWLDVSLVQETEDASDDGKMVVEQILNTLLGSLKDECRN